MENWQTDELENCLSELIDYRGKTPTKTSFGVPLITAKIVKNGRIETPNEFIAEANYKSWMTRGFPKIGDVLLTTEAPLGEVAQIKVEKVALAQRIILLRGKENYLDNTYLKYFLISDFGQSELTSRQSGTTVFGIKQSELRKIKITFPSFEEQKAIAKILSSLDDKIELNRQMNATLEAMARAVFKAWFVDFEPVRANSENRPSQSASPEIAKLFPSEFENDIPKGWQIVKLVDICRRITKGTTPKHFKEEGINFIKAESLSSDRSFISEKISFIDDETNDSLLRSQLQKDDILFSIAGTIGRIARVTNDILPANTNQALAIIRPNKSMVEPLLIELFLSRDENQNALSGKTVHAVQANLSLTVLGETKLSIPEIDTQARLFKYLNCFDQKIKENNRQSDTLKQIRDSLLPRLISGKIRVGEAESLAAEIA